eukprot:17083-Heterococcus_DN1.PRE.2
MVDPPIKRGSIYGSTQRGSVTYESWQNGVSRRGSVRTAARTPDQLPRHDPEQSNIRSRLQLAQ